MIELIRVTRTLPIIWSIDYLAIATGVLCYRSRLSSSALALETGSAWQHRSKSVIPSGFHFAVTSHIALRAHDNAVRPKNPRDLSA